MSGGPSFLDGLGGFDLGSLLEQLRMSPQGLDPQAAAPAPTMGLGPFTPQPLPIRGAGDTTPSGHEVGSIDQRRPSIAMSEDQTQALERAQAGPADAAALGGGSLLDRLLYDRSGFGGGPGGFAGSADPYGSRNVPMPPSRPSDADLLSAPTVTGSVPSPRGSGGGSNTAPGPQVSAASTGNPGSSNLQPVNSFDPLTGQPVSGSPKLMQAPGMGGPTEGAGQVAAASASATAPGQASGSFLQKFAQGLNNPAIGDLLLNVGIGLMSNRGFGPGIAAGLQGYQSNQGNQTKQLLQQYQLQQQIQGQQATRAYLQGKGLSPAAVEAATLNPALLSQITKDPQQFTFGGDVYLGRPDQDPSTWRKLGPSAGPQVGYQNVPGGQNFIEGGPADPKVLERNARAVATDKEQTPLVDSEARAAAGIPAYDQRPAWKDPNGKVTFDNGPAPKISVTRNPDGSSTAREYDPTTRSFREVPGGGGPGIDTRNVPPGADPLTYSRELAKAEVAERKGADQRAQQATAVVPILDRAQAAYERLAQNRGIGPVQSSRLNRMQEGARGTQNEIDRQEYEAARSELELAKAQIQMKGQGAITEGERALLARTLPSLDAASPETGLNTLRGLRSNFNRAIERPGLPGSQGAQSGQGNQGQTSAAISAPQGAVQALQQDPSLAAQFDAKYGRGASSRILGGR